MTIVVVVALGLVGVIAALSAVCGSRRLGRARLDRRNAELEAMLDTVPLTRFCWPAGEQRSRGCASSDPYAAFLAGLAVGAATRLEAARLALARGGIEFATVVDDTAGAGYRIDGRRARSGAIVLWLRDLRGPESNHPAAAQEHRLREMLDAIPVPVWRRGADFDLVDCNRAYAAALGASREQALAEGRELAAGGGHSAARRGEPTATNGDCRVRFHVVIDGSRRLLELVEAPSPTGGTIGWGIDCTEAEAARDELWRHIGAHGEVLESIHAGIAIFGADKRLKFFNVAFAALWGLPEQWLAAGPAFDELLEWLRERRRLPEVADFRRFKHERLNWFTSLFEPRQELIHRPDGRTLRLSVSPHPLGGLTFAYEDVTDHLALESSYNTLTQVQRATLDHLFEGIAVFGGDGRLKLHNPAYRTIWELTADDLAGEPHISQIVEKTRGLIDDGGDWAGKKSAILAAIAARTPTAGSLGRCDGSMLQQATVPLPDGEVLLTYLDVSDSARVERALREKAEALETAARLKSEFIANMSHELRTPLNTLIGFAEILTNQYFGPLNAGQLDYGRGILDSSHQLMSLVDDILDLATIEAGYMVLERGPVEIADLLQSVAGLSRERARSRGLDLELHCPPDIGSSQADGRRLKQALFNLISNAIKFTPPGGRITVAGARCGGELLLSVADTGTGIAPRDRDSRFAEFENSGHQPGAGLGLSLVKNLIELHGGTVAIELTPGFGTRITCRLPTPAGGAKAGRTKAGRVRRHKATPALGETAEPHSCLAVHR